MEAKNYVQNGEHLPDFMKDFHDQKDLFKAIYEQWCDENDKILNEVNWVTAHCFTIDYFLWWMGLHGYKLQKAKKKNVKFFNPIETIQSCNDKRRGKEAAIFTNALK